MCFYTINKLADGEAAPPNQEGHTQTIELPEFPEHVTNLASLLKWVVTDQSALTSIHTAGLALFRAFRDPKRRL